MVAPIKTLAAVARRRSCAGTRWWPSAARAASTPAPLARDLGMTRVLCSPHAGVLSALGIGSRGHHEVSPNERWPAGEPVAPVFRRTRSDLRPRADGRRKAFPRPVTRHSAPDIGDALPRARKRELTYLRIRRRRFRGGLQVAAPAGVRIRLLHRAAHRKLCGDVSNSLQSLSRNPCRVGHRPA